MPKVSLTSRLSALDQTVSSELRQQLGADQFALFQRENQLLQQRYASQKQKPVTVGDLAPDFLLPDQNGEEVRLSSLLQSSHVVIHFYRGSWCSFCNVTLQAHSEYQQEYESLDAVFIAVTPSVPEMTAVQHDCSHYSFPILSDVGGAVVAAYRLQLALTPALLRIHTDSSGLGINFTAHYRDDRGQLPIPATYIVERKSGRIVWAHVNADYKQRAEPVDIMLKLATLMVDGDERE